MNTINLEIQNETIKTDSIVEKMEKVDKQMSKTDTIITDKQIKGSFVISNGKNPHDVYYSTQKTEKLKLAYKGGQIFLCYDEEECGAYQYQYIDIWSDLVDIYQIDIKTLKKALNELIDKYNQKIEKRKETNQQIENI